MFGRHNPSNVGEEEASFHVVRVTVRVGELMVHSMIPTPGVQGMLIGQTIWVDAPFD